MSDYHCIEIEFPNVDFSKFGNGVNKASINATHHAHLYPRENEIELRIFFDEEEGFGDCFIGWTSKIAWGKFGSFIKIEITKNYTNDRIQRIDLSEAKLVGWANNTRFYENGKKYIVVKINTVKFYWNPQKTESNSAEFYLDDKGFRVVAPFYSVFSPKTWFKNDGNFNILRMKDSTRFYQLGKSTFRPEFFFVTKDDCNDRMATVTKEPKIQFKYKTAVTEHEAVFYGDIVVMLASFYHHIKIDYVVRKIHLSECSITIKNVSQHKTFETNGNLFGFGLLWDFNRFLQSGWQKETIKNFALLSRAISLFNQSHLVDSHSAFLIRYNIIEVCDKHKRGNLKFNLVLNEKQSKIKHDEALLKLLETIDESEHDEFKKRWYDVQAQLQNKPMKNQLASFLESQNINISTLPIKLRDLKRLRDDITHGSINKVNAEQLRQANILLYRLNGILILNLMGIKDWKLNTEIN